MRFEIDGLARLREVAECSRSGRRVILEDIADEIESEVAQVLSNPLIDVDAPREVRIAALEAELAGLRATAPAPGE